MLFKSPIFAQASGSIAGITFSRNRGGMYTRARAIPVNPNTAGQQAVRSAMSVLTSAWSNVLSAAQRTAWILYASNVPLINRVGDPINVTGLNMYVRSNVPRLRAGLTRVDDGPTNFTLADLSPTTLAATVFGNNLSIGYDDTAAWTSEDDAALIIQEGLPQQNTIIFYKSPFNFLANELGDALAPATSPASNAATNALFPGQNMFARVSLSRADGRLSEAQILSDIVA